MALIDEETFNDEEFEEMTEEEYKEQYGNSSELEEEEEEEAEEDGEAVEEQSVDFSGGNSTMSSIFDDEYSEDSSVKQDVYAGEFGTEVDNGALLEDADKYQEVITGGDGIIDDNGGINIMAHGDLKSSFAYDVIPVKNIIVMQNRIRSLTTDVDGLRESIRTTGLVDPIVVAPTVTEGVYVLVKGLRRMLAWVKEGQVEIPALINKKIKTTDIPIVEAIYGLHTEHTMVEKVNFIKYLEEEAGIAGSRMIEYLLNMENGDYAKLKDILDDDDDDIAGKLMADMLTIPAAFKLLENKRKKMSKAEKEALKIGAVYGDSESGIDRLNGSGEMTDGDSDGLSENEIADLLGELGDMDDEYLEDVDGEELKRDANEISGYQPHKQDPNERERLDPKLRKSVLARDENTCQICKAISGQEYVDVLDVHHIVEVYLGGTDAIENLTTACVVCHKLVHLFARGELQIRPFDEMEEAEAMKFKRVIKLGTIIRKGMAAKGMKKEELKKLDKADTIGRTLKGSSEQIAG